MSRRLWLPDWRDLTAAATTAVLLFVAYPPYGLVVPAFVCLVPVLWLLEDRLDPAASTVGAASLGFWAGLLASGLVLYWMVVALWHFTPLAARRLPRRRSSGAGAGWTLLVLDHRVGAAPHRAAGVGSSSRCSGRRWSGASGTRATSASPGSVWARR